MVATSSVPANSDTILFTLDRNKKQKCYIFIGENFLVQSELSFRQISREIAQSRE